MRNVVMASVCLFLACGVGIAVDTKAAAKVAKTEAKAEAKVAKTEVVVCTACGAIKGTPKCCDKTAKRCGCGMIKGTVGCCKVK